MNVPKAKISTTPMSLASTYFIKAQIPGITLHDLLTLYQREILIGGAGFTAIVENKVAFSGATDDYSPRHRGGRFSGFTNGLLIIEESETEFEVYLEADSPKFLLLFDVFFTTLRDDLERELQKE